ncbi:hypothetical protein [Allocoleopsis sp.]|uniref:hypothetical protein n=1 Tax=Allocoleopsis sp. TaxID=3088169 RepID=UPI002FCE8302
MAAILHPIYALAHFALAIWGIHLFQQSINIGTILLLIVLTGLIYDNLIISIGSCIGEGEVLEFLNRLRFLFHTLFTPLLLVVAVELANYAGVQWFASPIARCMTWLLALGLIEFEFRKKYLTLKLESTTFAGTLRYREAEGSLPMAAILTIALVALVGIIIWQTMQCPWVFIGALIMFLGSAVPTRLVGQVLGSGVEIVLVLSLLALK